MDTKKPYTPEEEEKLIERLLIPYKEYADSHPGLTIEPDLGCRKTSLSHKACQYIREHPGLHKVSRKESYFDDEGREVR